MIIISRVTVKRNLTFKWKYESCYKKSKKYLLVFIRMLLINYYLFNLQNECQNTGSSKGTDRIETI